MKISGRVFDSNNEPLASANVTLKSGSQSGKFGVITNLDGEFLIDSEAIEPDYTFEISYLGFISQNWSALALQDKKITLLDAVEYLNEVVVVGKPKLIKSSAYDSKNNIKEHFKKYKKAYFSVATIAGMLLIISKIKK